MVRDIKFELPAELNVSNLRLSHALMKLEEVQGERALAFAKQENAKTEEALGDPTASPTYKKILSVLESKEKIPSVSKIGEHYYNFWTSAENPRGLLRRVASCACM